jgi:succinate-semialdehyde dehydrogenase/glutarate-semialdehyde dehydrogenase
VTSAENGGLTSHLSSDLFLSLQTRIDVPHEGREVIDIEGPFTGEVIGSIPQAISDDVLAAAERARLAQKHWEKVPPKRRAEVLLRFHDLLRKHVDEIVDVIQIEGGKARLDAWNEVLDVIGCSRYFAKMTPKVIRRHRHQGAMPLFTKTYEFRHAKGLIGFISPWNYPFTLSISDALGALVSGNAVLIKPDEKTPFSALFGAKLLEEAGFPRDLVQIVTGRGAPIGETILDQVDYIMFTGSTEVGRLIAEMAGRRLIGTAMELGGKNAAIILPDADLKRTVRDLAVGCFANGGQTCVSMERIYVHEDIREEFTNQFVDHAAEMSLSAAYDFSSEQSSLIDGAQLDKVHSHVEEAISQGAALLTGGKPRPDVGPYFYAPTVLTDVTDDMDMCRNETFGPVAAIYGFSGVDDAIEQANDSEYGLHFSVWTRDTDLGVEVAQRLETGSVTVNDGLIATWASHEAPMGGAKASGLGRRHGLEGILKFTEPQTVAVQRLVPAYRPFGGLPTERYTRLVEFLTGVFRRLPFYK